MAEDTHKTDRLGASIFVLAAALRTFLLARFGQPPPSHILDINNYLELALNLWRDGTYGSLISRDYPPLYSMLLAPTFAIDSNAARFATIYAGHGVLLGLASLSLFPMLRRGLGARGAWLALAAAQFLAGANYHALATRTEVLFTCLIAFCVASVYAAFEKPAAWRWGLTGLLCGLAIACRRMGLVMPIAVAMVVVVEAASSRDLAPAARRLLQRSIPAALGLGIGLLPEIVASAIHGGTLETYHPGVMGSHLSPITRMWESPQTVFLALQTGLRQPVYAVMAFAGAPLVIAAVLARRRALRLLPVSLSAAAAVALLITLGLGGMATLHILRYSLAQPDLDGFHLYPRYLDPAEMAVVLSAVALAAAWWTAARRAEDIEAARATLIPWILPIALMAWLSGNAWRFPGGRLPSINSFRPAPLAEMYPAMLAIFGLLLLAALMAWWSLGRFGTAWTVVGVVVLGWALSLHTLIKPERWTNATRHMPDILTVDALTAQPSAPLSVVLRRRPARPRGLYEVAFQSDHLVDWKRPMEIADWLATNPGGFILTRSWEASPGHRLGLERVARRGRWLLWAPIGREVIEHPNSPTSM